MPGSNIGGAHCGGNNEKYTKTQRKTRVGGLEILSGSSRCHQIGFTPIRNAPAVAAAVKAPVQNDKTNRRNSRTSYGRGLHVWTDACLCVSHSSGFHLMNQSDSFRIFFSFPVAVLRASYVA
jgi:hypothetical protein